MTAQQGWSIDASAHTITFWEAPASGAAISVKEFATGARNATSVWALGAWGPYSGYPIDVEFFSNRLFFAGTTNNPLTVWSSKISQWTDFGTHVPIEDDDAISATLVSKQINAIQDLVPLKDLVTLTSGSEWRTTGGSNNVLTPSTISFVPQSNYGAAPLGSLVIGNSAVFVQRQGAHVRDLGYQFAVDQYTGDDLTVFATHLVQGFTIVDWCYQQEPFSTVWAVRNDGVLLGLAYFKEQKVMGWFHCDFLNGAVESVATVPEGQEDAVYLVIRREVNGETVRYVERLHTRFFEDQRDAYFVDAGLSYDGRGSTLAPAATMTLTGGTAWTADETLTLTASAAVFSASNPGDWVRLYIEAPNLDANGEAITDEYGKPQTTPATQVVKVTAYTSATVVSVQSVGPVMEAFQGAAIASWDLCPLTVSGMLHLEGQKVAILADASVADHFKVQNGAVTMQYPAAVIHVGLPIQADFETLEVNAIGQSSVRDRRKLISKVSLIVDKTRGLKIGPDAAHLLEAKSRLNSDAPWAPNSLNNDLIEEYIEATWSTKGRVFVRQNDPLPATILGLIADVSVAGG